VLDAYTLYTFSQLASDAYSSSTPLAQRLPSGYTVADFGYGPGYGHVDVSTQFFAAEIPGYRLVLSIRGTEQTSDLVKDAFLAAGLTPAVVISLSPVVVAAKAYAAAHDEQLYITGQSLGGALAEYLYTVNPSTFAGGVAFDSPGITSLGVQYSGYYDPNFVHFYRSDDLVGSYLPKGHIASEIAVLDDNHRFASSHPFASVHGSGQFDVEEANKLRNSVLMTGGYGNDFLPPAGNLKIHFLSDAHANSLTSSIIGLYDVTIGGRGADQFNAAGSTRPIWIDGADGDDVITGGAGNDHLAGGNGSNAIYGGAGDDQITTVTNETAMRTQVIDGGTGNDTIVAFSYNWQNEFVLGGAGDDHIFAGYGTGIIDAGPGNDVVELTYDDHFRVYLGAGAGVFQPTSLYGYNFAAIIEDFSSEDRVDLSQPLSTITAWDGKGNPFTAGIFSLVQTADGVALMIDRDGAGPATPSEYIDFTHTALSAFSAWTFFGFDPFH
jgi:hypothetical protein